MQKIINKPTGYNFGQYMTNGKIKISPFRAKERDKKYSVKSL